MNFDNRLFNFENMFNHFELHLNIGDLFQVAEVSLERGTEYFEHEQLCDEITYAVSGQAKIYSDGKCELLSEGQIHFIRKGCRHRIEAETDYNFRYICIAFLSRFDNVDVNNFMKSVGEKTYLIINDNGYVKRIAEMIIREFYNWDKHSNEMVDKFISQILIVMYRILNNKSEMLYKREARRNPPNVIYEVLRYIDSEYRQIESIKDISKALSYSEYYLSHLFKEKMGITMKEYLNKKKITHAIDLLTQCDLTIEQISDSLNYTSASAFRRVFKQYTGNSPSFYKKK